MAPAPTRRRKKKATLTPEVIAELGEMVDTIHANRAFVKKVNDDTAKLQEQVIAKMKQHRIDRFKSASKINASVIEGTSMVIDDVKLRRRLGARLWGKVTKTVLDKKMLEAAIAAKEVDPIIVAECTEEVPRTPYIKTTEGK